MNLRKILLLTVLAVAPAFLHAQNVIDLRISEAQVDSVSLDNGYGEKAPWVEVLNTSYGTVKFSGCFLTNDRNDLKKYFIPKTDNKTSVAPRQSVIFYTDGDPTKGAFHTNFVLKAGETVYFVSNDGRTIVDSLCIPASLEPGKSIAKFATDAKAISFDDIQVADPTPGSYNASGIQESKAERLQRTDPHGWTMTLVSVCVVFSALIILFLAYSFVGWLCTGKYKSFKPKKKEKKSKAPAGKEDEIAAAIAMALSMENGNETEAAIALALHCFLNEQVHDQESYIITIKRK